MDIATISSIIAEKLVATQALTDKLLADAKNYISDMQTSSEMMYLPAITVDAANEFNPSDQHPDITPPIQGPSPVGPALPTLPPGMILHDYVAAEPISMDKASDFADLSIPSADNPSININEDGTVAANIAALFIAAVMAEIGHTNFDDGYLQQIRDGITNRTALGQTIATRVKDRLAIMNLSSTELEMLTLAGYHSADDSLAMTNKHREAKVENDKLIVETGIRLAEMLYQHADQVYQRAIEVAKTAIEIGHAIYQMQIGIERTSIGVVRTAIQTDIEVVNAKESINKLNFHAREQNVRIFEEVASLAVKGLENITSQYELAVARYGISIDKARGLADFDMSKGSLSLQALGERVNIAIQNTADALESFISIAQSKRYATQVGESVYSEAINGAMQARNTLTQMGKKDTTTGSS